MSDPVVLLSTGDVVGPAGGVTDNSMVLFSGTSGKLIKGNNAQVTSAGLALLDDIDANAQLTTLGLTTTQPQFDNSVKQATTKFVQRALGNTRGIIAGDASRVLTVADIGVVVLVSPGVTLTLPLANSVPPGSVIHFRTSAGGANRIIAASGGDTVALGMGVGASAAMQDGDTLSLVSNGSNAWINIGGVTGLGNTAQFGASLTSNGYQKLPSGVIIQWGAVTVSAINGNWQGFTYPIRFPNDCFQVVGGRDALGSNAVMLVGRAGGDPAGQVIFQNYGAGAEIGRYIAIGY